MDKNESCLTCENLNNINNALTIVYPLVLIPFGTIFNSITFFIYTRKHMFKSSAGFYFSILAVVETLALVFGSFKFTYNKMNNTDLISLSNFHCKFFTVLIYILNQFASWILVIISIDRLILIQYPYKFIGNKFEKIRKLFVVFLFIFILTINIQNLIYLKLNVIIINNGTENLNSCNLDISSSYTDLSMNIIDLFMASLIPFTLMLTSGLFISKKVIESKKKLTNIEKLSVKKKYKLVSTILARNFFFLILNLPISVMLIIQNYRNSLIETFENELIEFIITISNICVYINYSFSFFVNFIFNEIFRNMVINLVKNGNKISVTNTTV
jgi:hypothetical protein